MLSILNKTPRPLKIRLPGDKILHLGPFKTGKVHDATADLPSFRRHVDNGEIMILGDHSAEHEPPKEGMQTQVHESTHGHPQSNVVQVKGNR